jgi:hypothetical protein
MEVVEARGPALTNCEVLHFLRDQRTEIRPGKPEKGKPKQKVNKSLLTVTLETIAALELTPAGQQEEHHLRELALQLGELCSEQVATATCNLLMQPAPAPGREAQQGRADAAREPQAGVCRGDSGKLRGQGGHYCTPLQLLIENSEERLTDEQVVKMLEVVASCLPGPAEEEEEAGEEGQEGGTEES